MLNKLMVTEHTQHAYKNKLQSDTEVHGSIAQQVKEVIGDFGVDAEPTRGVAVQVRYISISISIYICIYVYIYQYTYI